MLDREDLGNGPAGRMADDMGPLDLERIHQSDHIGRHAIDCEAAARRVALPDPAMVMGYDVELAREGRRLVLPE